MFFFYIRNQLLFFIFFIFCFFCITSLFIVINYNKAITNKIYTITESYTATISSSLTLLERNTRETASLLKNSLEVQSALSSDHYDITSTFEYNQAIRNRVVNIMHVNSAIRMIYVGNTEYNYYYNLSSNPPIQGIKHFINNGWLESYDEDSLFSGIWMTGNSLNIPASNSLFFVQKVRNLNTIQPVGFIIIEVDSSFLDEAINTTAFETDTTIAFVKDNNLLYRNSLQFSEDTLIQVEKEHETNHSSDFQTADIHKKKYFVTGNYNATLDLSIISIISYHDLMKEAAFLHMVIIILILLFFLFLFFAAYHFSSKLVKQVTLIKNVFSHNLTMDCTIPLQPFREDEIGQIGKECVMLLSKYNTAIKQSYELNMKQKESELLRLQEQINPHFLYNTLDSIFWMCESNGNHDAAQMSLYLSRYFRSNIGKDELTISIKEEINNIQNYLAIQNIRYQGKFHFIVDVSKDLYSEKILRMLIQPLIENSIFHGLEPKNGTGTVTLSICKNNDILVITVTDNGVGFPIEGLKKGLALKNVDERIKLFYGESYGLKITSQPSFGTIVTLTLSITGG